MKMEILEGKWEQLHGEIQEQWSELTGDDLDLIKGRREQLEGKLRERYGWSKRKARKEVDKFLRDLNGQAEDARRKVKQRVQDAQSKAQEAVHEAQSKMEETVQEAQERLQQRVSTAKDKVESRADEYNLQARESAPEEMVYVVDEYPWLVIAGALLFGVLIGVLLSPSKR